MNTLEAVHSAYVHTRRIRVLSRHLAPLIPHGCSLLDVGCGDGLLSLALSERRPDLAVEGADVLVRKDARIPVQPFDGRRLPHGDSSFDAVLFVDVLHHADDPPALLREAVRVSRRVLLVKDHVLRGFLARPTLRLMDWVGNARHGVALPYNYWPEERWRSAFRELGLEIHAWIRNLGLYPSAADWLFGRSLHFVARLEKPGSENVRNQIAEDAPN